MTMAVCVACHATIGKEYFYPLTICRASRYRSDPQRGQSMSNLIRALKAADCPRDVLRKARLHELRITRLSSISYVPHRSVARYKAERDAAAILADRKTP